MKRFLEFNPGRVAARGAVCASALLLAAAALPAAHAVDHAVCGIADNAVSAFPITTDGLFTPDPATGEILEWSDVAPLAFNAPEEPGGRVTRVCDPGQGNSFLYVAIAQGVGGDGEVEHELELYLLYDYLPRTFPLFAPGETVAVIEFPVNLPEALGGGKQPIAVIVREPGPGAEASSLAGGNFFDVFVDMDRDGVADGRPEELGLDIGAAASFGPSPSDPVPHLIVELEVSLRIQPGFADPAGPLPGNGINPATGLYDPDPVFWGGSFPPGDDRGGGGNPRPSTLGAIAPLGHLGGTVPGTAATFEIHPDGTTTADSTFIPEDFDILAEKAAVLDKLYALLGAGNLKDKDRKRIEKAIERIEDSLESVNGDGSGPTNQQVFKDESKAIHELLKVLDDKKSGLTAAQRALLGECIDALTSLDRNVALAAIADAEARFGDAERIAKAKEKLAKGDAKAADGDPDKAVNEYRKAWEEANKA